MNPVSQPDLHPDADLLNAFVEHALPEAERGRVVAHMAGCPRCRDIVFLARAAAELEIAPAPAIKPEPRPARFSAGFRKWRVALIPAGAMAAVAAIVFWVQLHPVQPTQMAKLVPPTTLHASQAEPAQTPPLAAGTPQQPAAAGGARRDARSSPMARYAPPPQPLGPPSAEFSIQPSHAELQQQLTLKAAPSAPVTITSPASSAAPVPAPPDLHVVSGRASIVSAAPAQANVQAEKAPEFAPQSLHTLSVVRFARPVRLPSGRNVVSSAALLNRLVAIDSAGSVFLSQDGGNHWDSVKLQWSGKAVEVQAPPQGYFAFLSTAPAKAGAVDSAPAAAEAIPPGESTAPAPGISVPAAARSATKPKAAPPDLAVEFKLVTDRRQVWLSADGKVWRSQ